LVFCLALAGVGFSIFFAYRAGWNKRKRLERRTGENILRAVEAHKEKEDKLRFELETKLDDFE
jgi:hypothetical protein